MKIVQRAALRDIAAPHGERPTGTRGNQNEPQAFKSGVYNLAAKFPGEVLDPTWINNVQRIMPKGEVVPVPNGCPVIVGAPMALADDEDRVSFLVRARQAVEDWRKR